MINCELFVNYLGDREKLKIKIVSFVNGVSEKFGLVDSPSLGINIKENELYNSVEYGGIIPEENDEKRPYYYKYRINIEPKNDNIEEKLYLDSIRSLVEGLKNDGMKVFLSPDIINKRN